LIDANDYIGAWVSGARGRWLPTVGTYGRRNRLKASAILAGKPPLSVMGLRGKKVRAFYDCMVNLDSLAVCIDRHAKIAAFGLEPSEENAMVGTAEYDYLVRHYQTMASRFEVLPHQFQAVVWVTWRRLKGQLNQNDLPF
jgi:hypothetical protein